MKSLLRLLGRGELANRLFHGAFWSVLGAVFSSGINIAGMLFVARLLGKSDYGEVVAVQSTLGTAGIIAGFGVGSTATRYTAKLRRDDPGRMLEIMHLCQSTVLVFGVAVIVLLLIFSSYISEMLFKAPQLGPFIQIAALSVLFSALDSFHKCILIGLEAMKRVAKGTLIANMLGMAALISLVLLLDIKGAILGIVLNSLIQFFVSRRQLNNELKGIGSLGVGFSFPAGQRYILWKYSLPALMSAATVTPLHWIAQGVLARGDGGLGDVAVLGIAMQWLNLILFVPNTAGRVVLPVLSERVGASSKSDSKKILMWTATANGLIAIPLSGIVAYLSGDVLKLYGDNYAGQELAIVFAVLTASILAIISPIGNLIAASGRMWIGFATNLIWAVLYILGVSLFSQYGAVGVMGALCFAYLIHSLSTTLFAVYFFKE